MKGKKVFILPDAQVKSGVPLGHLKAAGRYIIEKKPDIVVCLGDFWDMESLSSYEKAGSIKFEGQRYRRDIEVGNKAMCRFLEPITEYNVGRGLAKKKRYSPRMIFLLGNHEQRILRAIEENPRQLEGMIGLKDLFLKDWEVYPYQEIVSVEGILFSHNFVNPYSLKKAVLGGTIDNKLQKVGASFVMGHQQQLQFGTRTLPTGKNLLGIVAGSYYQHDEDYMGVQGNNHWRGCVVLHDTKKGYGDPMMLSLDYMMRNHG